MSEVRTERGDPGRSDRSLPIGSACAALDGHTYGKWPGAVECKGCAGTGNYYGRDEDGDWLDCDECQGRGWNPPGTVTETKDGVLSRSTDLEREGKK